MHSDLVKRAETMREMRRIAQETPNDWSGPEFWRGIMSKVAKIIVDDGEGIDEDRFETLMSIGAGAYRQEAEDHVRRSNQFYANDRLKDLRHMVATASEDVSTWDTQLGWAATKETLIEIIDLAAAAPTFRDVDVGVLIRVAAMAQLRAMTDRIEIVEVANG